MAKITVRQIETAKPSDKPYSLTADRGLTLYIPVSGKKVWNVRYYIHGKQRFATLPLPYGNGPGKMSLAEAVVENARIQGLARQDIDFKEEAAFLKKREEEEKKRKEIET